MLEIPIRSKEYVVRMVVLPFGEERRRRRRRAPIALIV
jgi:cell division GTPase FtsZ